MWRFMYFSCSERWWSWQFWGCWRAVSDEPCGSQRLIHSFGKCSSACNTLSVRSLVLNNITDGLLVKSLKDKSICYDGLFCFISTTTQDYQKAESRGGEVIKGATADRVHEARLQYTLDLTARPSADAIYCTSCANFYFRGISFQTSSATHNVH